MIEYDNINLWDVEGNILLPWSTEVFDLDTTIPIVKWYHNTLMIGHFNSDLNLIYKKSTIMSHGCIGEDGIVDVETFTKWIGRIKILYKYGEWYIPYQIGGIVNLDGWNNVILPALINSSDNFLFKICNITNRSW